MDYLEVGKIINTHGLRGEVKVAPWTDTPDVFEDFKTLYLKNQDTSLTLMSVKYQKNNLILKFKELTDINQAEKLKNSVLLVDRSTLEELPEGVFYIADLIGLVVKNEAGELLGKLKDVLQTGANDVYEVSREGKKDLLIPVIDEVVLKVDFEKNEVIVRLLDGLEDL